MPAVPTQPSDAASSTSTTPEHPTGISTEYFEAGWRGPSSSKVGKFAFADTGERFELNFNEADIRGVIDVVLG